MCVSIITTVRFTLFVIYKYFYYFYHIFIYFAFVCHHYSSSSSRETTTTYNTDDKFTTWFFAPGSALASAARRARSISFRASNGEAFRIRDSEPPDSDILTYCDGGVREPRQTEEEGNELICSDDMRVATGREGGSTNHPSMDITTRVEGAT